MNGSQRVVLGAWLAMIGLATARSLTQKKGLPQPGVFLSSAVLFSGYYVLAGFLGVLPAIFAVGTDVAAVTLPYFKGQTTGPLNTFADALGKLDGSTTPKVGA
jgi:hypothetical protein